MTDILADLDEVVPGELDKTAPAVIWLQIDTTGDNNDRSEPWPGADGVTWQDESIGGLEIQYVRADLVVPMLASARVPDGWQPTPANINALPLPLRKYIMMLETEADPAGTIRQNILVSEENDMLRAALTEALEAAPKPEKE